MKYKVEITNIGPLAAGLLEAGDMVIFEQCEMQALAEVCFMHTKGKIEEQIKPGDRFSIGEKVYTVTAVGSEAQHTLETLGHCTLKFTDMEQTELPGQINLKGDGIPNPQIGDIICIE